METVEEKEDFLNAYKVQVSISYSLLKCGILVIPVILLPAYNLVHWDLIPKGYDSDLLCSLSWEKSRMNFIYILFCLLTFTVTFYCFIYWIIYLFKVPYNKFVGFLKHLIIAVIVYNNFLGIRFIGPYGCVFVCLFFIASEILIDVMIRKKRYKGELETIDDILGKKKDS